MQMSIAGSREATNRKKGNHRRMKRPPKLFHGVQGNTLSTPIAR